MDQATATIVGLDELEQVCREMIDLIRKVKAQCAKLEAACGNLHTEVTYQQKSD